jgi:hypothetical protein
MRTLTQVWVFLLSLTFIFMLFSFQILGRIGLFFAFLIGLFLLHAAIRNSLRLFKGPLMAKPLIGNDPIGFLSEIEAHKASFGLNRVDVHISQANCPPLVWKENESHGFILLNEKLLNHLDTNETRLLALFCLAHIECRSFVAVHILSIIKIPIYLLSFFSKPISYLTHAVLKTQLDIYNADLKFISQAASDKYEVGYFLNKLHNFKFNSFTRPNAYNYFSTRSLLKSSSLNEFGLPKLDSRIRKIVGFSLS